MARAWHCDGAMISLRFVLMVLAAALALSCDPTPPVDQNFDSSLGADFVAPPIDAGTD